MAEPLLQVRNLRIEGTVYPPGERRNPRAHARWTEKHLAEGRAHYAAAGEAQRKRLDKIMGTA